MANGVFTGISGNHLRYEPAGIVPHRHELDERRNPRAPRARGRWKTAAAAVAALATSLAWPQAASFENRIAKSNYTIFSGDLNGDGYIDILARAKVVFAIIPLDDLSLPIPLPPPVPTFVILSGGGGSYALSTDVGPSVLNSSVWRADTHDLVFGDILGNGAGGAIIEARDAGGPSFSLTATSAGQPQLLQNLNGATLGYDLSAHATTTELNDQNGDGRTDLTVRQNGLIAAVFYANASGIFVADQEGTIRANWRAFKAQLDAGNMNGALLYVSEASAPVYSEVMQRLGTHLSEAGLNWSDIKAIDLGPSYASFAVFDTTNGQRTMHQVVFVRENDRWVLESL